MVDPTITTIKEDPSDHGAEEGSAGTYTEDGSLDSAHVPCSDETSVVPYAEDRSIISYTDEKSIVLHSGDAASYYSIANSSENPGLNESLQDADIERAMIVSSQRDAERYNNYTTGPLNESMTTTTTTLRRKKKKKMSGCTQVLLGAITMVTVAVVAMGGIFYFVIFAEPTSDSPPTNTIVPREYDDDIFNSLTSPPGSHMTEAPAPTHGDSGVILKPSDPEPTMAPIAIVTTTNSPTAAPYVNPTMTPIITSSAPSVAPVTAPPSPSPTKSKASFWIQYLQNNYNITFPDDPEAPVNKALTWMLTEQQERDDLMAVNATHGKKLAQRFALATLDFSLVPVNSTSTAWLNNFGVKNQDECYWQGVTCDVNDMNETVVTELAFADLNLTGTIPTQISMLQDLTKLDLSQNHLYGSIPEEVYGLTELDHIYLYQNQLAGSISESIGNLHNLTHLHLSHNQLTGSIPLTMRSEDFIRPYRYLNFYSNQLTGSIPSSLGWRGLFYLDFGRNQMNGTLPEDLNRFVDLRVFHLDHNQFTGTIPWSFTTIGNNRMVSTSLDNNQFTGYLPSHYKVKNQLVHMTVHNNSFTEKIDKKTCKLSVFDSGEMVEFKADCDVCSCDIFCDHCY